MFILVVLFSFVFNITNKSELQLRSFVYYLRPVLIIDGAHLKGRYLGTNFLAVGMDANNQILPVAYGVGKTESGETWIWFLSKLKECIGEIPGLAFISDRSASIDLSIRQVFPHAYHGLCCRHLMVNLGLNTKEKKMFQKLYWKTCKAYRVSDFEEWKTRLEAAVPTTSRIMLQAGVHKWSRAHFPGERFNIMTSNSAESINALSKYARKLPIIMLVEFFRQSVQDWYFVRHETSGKVSKLVNLVYCNVIILYNFCLLNMFAVQLPNEFTPWAESKFEKRKFHSLNWKTRGISQTQFEVDDGGKKGLVNFGDGTCSCRKWQLSGIPCGHVISVARWLRIDDCNQYFSGWYSKRVYQQTYEDKIFPLPAQSEWEQPSGLMNVHPPLMDKRQSGRPREINRILSRGEEKREIECSRCHNKGHMRNKCTASVPSESKWLSNTRKLFGKKKSQPSEKAHHQYATNTSDDEMYDPVNLGDF